MADYHKIHPVRIDVPPPPPPAAPANLPHFEKSETASHAPQLPLTTPAGHARPPKRHGRCCRCLCCAALTVVVVVILLGATAGILYLVFRPKIPDFHVDRLTVTRFDVDDNMTVHDSFAVEVTARNPNKRIGIYYDDGSSVTAWYNDIELCSGAFPTLYQGHRNTTVFHITLTGETKLNNALISDLRQQQQSGSIPLTVSARVPVRIKFGAIKLWRMTGKAHCRLIVDSLKANNEISIRSNSCKFKLKL